MLLLSLRAHRFPTFSNHPVCIGRDTSWVWLGFWISVLSWNSVLSCKSEFAWKRYYLHLIAKTLCCSTVYNINVPPGLTRGPVAPTSTFCLNLWSHAAPTSFSEWSTEVVAVFLNGQPKSSRGVRDAISGPSMGRESMRVPSGRMKPTIVHGGGFNGWQTLPWFLPHFTK